MNRLLNRLSTLGLLLLFTFSFTYLAAGCFGFTLDGLMPLWLACICLSVWISADFRHGILLGLPLSALILYIAYRTYDGELVLQLSDFFDRLTGAYYQRFYSPGSRYVFADYSENHSLILLFLAFLLASYLSTGLTSRGGRIFFSLIGTVPPVFFCLAVTGKPSVPAIAGLTLFWVLLLSGGGRYDVNSHQGRVFFAVALPAVLLTGLLLFAVSPESYVSSMEEMSISLRIEEFGRSIRQLIRGEEPSPRPGATPETVVLEAPPPSTLPEEMDFGGSLELAGGYDFTGMSDVILRAKTDLEGYVYLRARSYGDYTGLGWLEAEEPGLPSSLSYAASAAAGEEHELELRLEPPSAYRFLPYYSALPSSSDSFVPSEGQTEYTVPFRSLGAVSPLPAELRQEEEVYRAYAYEAYTRLPAATETALLQLAERAGLSASSPDLIQAVADYVQRTGTYDLGVSDYPSEDYAVYFLTEARRGYCIHFATAAAALYRALGIPARVTEGFLYRAESGEWTDVCRSDAHAWVEIYSDGLGWLPVEVTGRSGLTPPEAVPVSPAIDSPAPEASPEPVEETPIPTPESSPTGPAVGPISPEGPAVPEPAGFSIPWRALGIVAAVLLLISLLPLQRLVRLALLRRRIRQRDGHKAAVAIYRQAVKLSAWGASVPEAITKCAEKAAFSNHEVRREELAACRALLEGMTKEVYAEQNRFRKFVFRYLKCFM